MTRSGKGSPLPAALSITLMRFSKPPGSFPQPTRGRARATSSTCRSPTRGWRRRDEHDQHLRHGRQPAQGNLAKRHLEITARPPQPQAPLKQVLHTIGPADHGWQPAQRIVRMAAPTKPVLQRGRRSASRPLWSAPRMCRGNARPTSPSSTRPSTNHRSEAKALAWVQAVTKALLHRTKQTAATPPSEAESIKTALYRSRNNSFSPRTIISEKAEPE